MPQISSIVAATTTAANQAASTSPSLFSYFGPPEYATIIVGALTFIGVLLTIWWKRSDKTISQDGGSGSRRAVGGDYKEHVHADGEGSAAASGDHSVAATFSIGHVDRLIVAQPAQPAVGELADGLPPPPARESVIELSGNPRYISGEIERIFPGSGSIVRDNYAMISVATTDGDMGVLASRYLRIFHNISQLFRESPHGAGVDIVRIIQQLDGECSTIEQLLVSREMTQVDACVQRGEGQVLALLGRLRI